MVKITINWDLVSPFLQTISGILIIENIDINSAYHDKTLLLSCKVYVSNTPKTVDYRSIKTDEGYSSKIFKKYEDKIDIMVSSYFKGLLLKKSDYTWIDD